MILLKNYKAVIAFITVLFVPLMLTMWSFIISTSQTNAKTPMMESRIMKLEQNSYTISAQYEMIQKSLTIIENRDYEERTQRRTKNKE